MMRKDTLPKRWDWYAVLLLLALIAAAAIRLSITDWTSELDYVETIAIVGAMLGVMLGRSQLGSRSAWMVALAFTLIVIPLQVAHVVHGETNPANILHEEWTRLGLAFQQLFAKQPVYDPIFFVTLVSSLYWWMGLHCGYQLLRGGRLLSIIVPPTIPTLIVQYYDANDPNRIWLLAVYFILLLLLIGRIHNLYSREKRDAVRVFNRSESEFDLARSVLVLTFAIVLLAWALPTPGTALPAAARLWQKINEPYQTAVEWLNQTMDAVRGRNGNGLQAYGNTLGLGIRANQGTKTVFRVTPPTLDIPRYYWQMRVYDTYEQGTWGNSHKNWSRGFTPNDDNLPLSLSKANVASFKFRWEGDASTLLAAPSQPVWVSLSGTIQYEDTEPGQIDLTSWRIDPYLQSGMDYTARAALLSPTVAALRNTDAQVPQWVAERYLQTPEDLPKDVRELARSLTANQPTQYDKVNAVTAYLRREIKYSPEIAPPPSGIDPLDWFLFTWKSGYCNYYATAEVLMLRSVGIPARMVVGYAEGQREPDGQFTVRERDSHAWPQIYFDGIGWVDFEPTASQPALARPAGNISGEKTPPTETDTTQGSKPTPQNGQNSQPENVLFPYQSIGVWVIIVFAAGYGIWRARQALGQRIPQSIHRLYRHYGLNIPTWLEQWKRWSDLSDVERSFHAINQSLMWLGKPQPPYVTPNERAENLKILLPVLNQEIDILTKEHENTLFSQTPGDPQKAAHAAWMIRSQTARAILRRFVGVKDE